MCSNASVTEILGINDKNLVILGKKRKVDYTINQKIIIWIFTYII